MVVENKIKGMRRMILGCCEKEKKECGGWKRAHQKDLRILFLVVSMALNPREADKRQPNKECHLRTRRVNRKEAIVSRFFLEES
jgi:hypothetical protein